MEILTIAVLFGGDVKINLFNFKEIEMIRDR